MRGGGNSFGFFILFALLQPSFWLFFCFFLMANLIKNLKLKIKLLISLRIHSYLFNNVQKSHSKKRTTAGSNSSDRCIVYCKTISVATRFIALRLSSQTPKSLACLNYNIESDIREGYLFHRILWK